MKLSREVLPSRLAPEPPDDGPPAPWVIMMILMSFALIRFIVQVWGSP